MILVEIHQCFRFVNGHNIVRFLSQPIFNIRCKFREKNLTVKISSTLVIFSLSKEPNVKTE